MSETKKPINKFEKFESAKRMGAAVNERTRIAKRLGALMTKERKGLRELSAVADVSYEMARRYVTGAGMPSYERIEKIADWLGVDADWLAYGDADEQADYTPKRNGIPVFKTSDRSLREKPSTYIDVGLRNEELAVMITNPLGIEVTVGNIRMFKAGDICIIGDKTIGLNDYVLIEAKDAAALNRYMIRRVEFDGKMNPVFASNTEGYPRLTTDEFDLIGRVTGILSEL